VPENGSNPETTAARAGWFTTTHWSVVLTAKDGDSPHAAEAMEKLCRTYWPPLYAYIRRDGYSETDAEDLTQEFFVDLLEKDFLTHLKHKGGKFRSFLLVFLKHFLSDQRDKAGAQKRGGGKVFISLNEFAAHNRNEFEPADTRLTPDQVFERRWAQTVMEQALKRLRDEHIAEAKAELFAQLKDFQPGVHGAVTYADVGARLGLSEGGVKSAMHRLRQRHREILREEIAQTVTRPEEIAEEVRHLIGVVGRQQE
jgi:RNA polymerase sigma factor (sigma-70 family)